MAELTEKENKKIDWHKEMISTIVCEADARTIRESCKKIDALFKSQGIIVKRNKSGAIINKKELGMEPWFDEKTSKVLNYKLGFIIYASLLILLLFGIGVLK